jgi:hypothetical protein
MVITAGSSGEDFDGVINKETGKKSVNSNKKVKVTRS